MLKLLLISFYLLNLIQSTQAYIIQGRFGHSALIANDSIYFYGGDLSVTGAPNKSNEWTSELSILPIHSSYPLTSPPWKPASGPQDSIGGPFVSSHIAILGGPNNRTMIIVGGLMPQTDQFQTDEEPMAYSYDCDLGRWNSFSLPSKNNLNRQGAASITTKNGIAYIWGGKRTVTKNNVGSFNQSRPALSVDMYRFDSHMPANSGIVATQGTEIPSLRYGHTQTLISDNRIVVLGGFDGSTGDSISLSDVWVYDITTSSWLHIQAKLDSGNKPANRSSHSQVLMPDGFSILVYGGYDGYHVYNDVAVLDTRTWTWTVKNTNAAVQGRADHTATLVGTNMIVAFGFTGVSTALTVMSDIEVLDTITWSWTAVYTPSGSVPGNDTGESNGSPVSSGSGSPSIAIIAGAVTGGIVVFILILIAVYIISDQHKKQEDNEKTKKSSIESDSISSDTLSIESTPVPRHSESLPVHQKQQQRKISNATGNLHHGHRISNRYHDQQVKFRDPPSSTEPFEYDPYAPTHIKVPHPLQINTANLPTRSDTQSTSNTNKHSVILLPSPWATSFRPHLLDGSPPVSPLSATSIEAFTARPILSHPTHTESMVRRTASTPSHHHCPMPSLGSISKPDDTAYPATTVRRAVTISETNLSKEEIIKDGSVSSSESDKTAIIINRQSGLNQDPERLVITTNTVNMDTTELSVAVQNTTITAHTGRDTNITIHSNSALCLSSIKDQATYKLGKSNNSTSTITSFTTCNNTIENEDNGSLFDRQEFILQSDEVTKSECDSNILYK